MDHVRTADVRALLRVMGETRELLDAGQSHIRHFLVGLAQITQSQVAARLTAFVPPTGAPPVFGNIWDVGWATDADRKRVYDYVAASPLDPLTSAALARSDRVVTLTRADAISTHSWHNTEARNEVHRPSGIDDSLLSLRHHEQPGDVSVMVLKRSWGDSSFDAEERSLLDLVHSECQWVFDAQRDVPPAFDGKWSRRQRQTLEQLLTGASEKQIAARLGISHHTVHDYVKTIYRKLGAASRAELMAHARTVRSPSARNSDGPERRGGR